jgi:HSP20 family protein
MALSPFFGYDPFVPRGYNDFSLSPFPTRDSNDFLSSSLRGFDIEERDGTYHISVDVPGVKAADVKVEVEDDNKVLHVYGGRKVTKGDRVSETRFDKRFTIGDNVDIEKMTAKLEDGVLCLEAPKKEESRPKTRTIQVSDAPRLESAAE